LINNAIKFTDEGEIEFGYFLRPENTPVFYVKDTGIGIPKDKQTAIFNRFQKVSEDSTRIYDGSGLGLTISKNLVELMGGKMWVESESGKGSCFYFTLPYEPVKEKSNSNPASTSQAKYNWNGKTILVVEDDLTSQEYLKESIAKTHAEVKVSETGKRALQECSNDQSIDLILMDIRLPDINGLDVTREIREMNNQVPVIAQTAYAMTEDRDTCISAGANDYLSKPIEVDDLLSMIDKYI